MNSGSIVARLLIAGWLVIAIGACSDPGSGGTGVPGTASSQVPVSSGDASAPVEGEGCPAPVAAGVDPYDGKVRSLKGDCLVVGQRSILIDSATIERRSGGEAYRSDLVEGTLVIVQPMPDDPTHAQRVTIIDWL